MWWIFLIWMFLGIVVNIFMLSDKAIKEEINEKQKVANSKTASFREKEACKKEIEELKKEKKASGIGWQVVMWIGVAILFLGICWLIGFIWYFVCCGFLVIEEPSFLWKIIYGALSLVFLGFVLTIFAEIFGWGTWKK